MKKLTVFSLGVAIFTMFFGAGNIVFPLHIGQETGSMVSYAMLGFIITAVCVPLLGLVATLLYEGSYKNLLCQIGKIPGLLLIFFCMILIGPFGAIPRCLVLSYSAVHWYLPSLSLFVWSVLISFFVFVLTYRESKVITILGRVIGPLKISLLSLVIVLGLLAFRKFFVTDVTPVNSFVLGISEGYYTMDLLGGIFFASLIFEALNRHLVEDTSSHKKMLKKAAQASLLGGGFLALIYVGFGIVSAIFGKETANIPQEELLTALVVKVLGDAGGILANITVAVACLATAIALTTIFAEYIHIELSKKKLSYTTALVITVVATIFMTNLGFSGIMKVIGPMVVSLYPAFIALSIASICKKFWGKDFVKISFFATLAITLFLQYGKQLI